MDIKIKADGFIVAWWSAGVTSAVACKMALEMYDNVKLYYIKINSAHPDNERFKKDCEKWYGCDIETLQAKDYKDQFEVIEKTGAINTPQGAPCTKLLKKQVRFDLEAYHEINLFNDVAILNQVWGFEYETKEINRAIRHGQQYSNTNPLFPLIEKGLSKNNCAGILNRAGIELPEMYKLGYNNNNCIGCVKGGMGYWNKIRQDFPLEFQRMAKLERKKGYSCLHNKKEGNIYLDQLDPARGKITKEVMPSCGIVCDVEFADLEDKYLRDVIEGDMTIYNAIAA
ncbi:MAG: phosphoadenosine phosphosulfate reductase family protein [Pseudomonadota bacterium]